MFMCFVIYFIVYSSYFNFIYEFMFLLYFFIVFFVSFTFIMYLQCHCFAYVGVNSTFSACVLLCFIDPRVNKIRNQASSCPGIFSRTLRFYYVASSPGSPLPHLLDGHVLCVLFHSSKNKIQHTDISNLKRFEQIELQAKLLNYFLGSNKSNINQSSTVLFKTSTVFFSSNPRWPLKFKRNGAGVRSTLPLPVSSLNLQADSQNGIVQIARKW